MPQGRRKKREKTITDSQERSGSAREKAKGLAQERCRLAGNRLAGNRCHSPGNTGATVRTRAKTRIQMHTMTFEVISV